MPTRRNGPIANQGGPDDTMVREHEPNPGTVRESEAASVDNQAPEPEDAKPDEMPSMSEAIGSVLEKGAAEPEPLPQIETATGEEKPVAAKEPAAPVPSAEPEDPEYDFGDRGKYKKSYINDVLDYAAESYREQETRKALQSELESRKAAYDKLGGLDKLQAFREQLGPYASQFDDAVVKLKEDFMRGLQENPAAAAAAMQMNPLQAQVAEIRAMLQEERKAREEWFGRQRVASLASEFKTAYGKDPSPPQLAALDGLLARNPGQDPRALMSALFGQPSSPVKGAARPPVSVVGPPTRAKAPATVPVSDMNPQERKKKMEEDVGAALERHFAGRRRF